MKTFWKTSLFLSNSNIINVGFQQKLTLVESICFVNTLKGEFNGIMWEVVCSIGN